MPKLHHMPEAHAEHPNVVPLIDVMLCIIVFYMLAARIGVESGADESITLPTVTFGKELKEVGSAGQLVLNVRELGDQSFITGIVEDEKTGSTAGGLRELRLFDNATGRRPLFEVLKRLRVGPDGLENTADDNRELKVMIRGDANMAYRTFFPVLKEVMDAGVKNVFYTAERPKAGQQEPT